MGFYEKIAKYYDYIFPASKEQLNFITRLAGEPPRTLIDIACGTGGYSIELSKQGYILSAVDMDGKMIESLQNKAAEQMLDINCIKADMLELEKMVSMTFDFAFCIGNSVVHLDSKEQILAFFKSAKRILNGKGSFLLQIINFDRIVLKDIKHLPTITNEDVGLEFERFYRFGKDRNKIFFRSVLKVDGEKIENEIPLYPLLYEETFELLEEAGFESIKSYGDFNGGEYSRSDSYMLIINAS